MKKVLATLAIVMLMFSSMAFATSARIDGLGVPAWMTQDQVLVYDIPSQFVNYGNEVVFEDGNNIRGRINAVLGEGVVSLSMVPNSNMANQLINNAETALDADAYVPDSTGLATIGALTGIGYALDLGDGMAVGVNLLIGLASTGEEDNMPLSGATIDTSSAMELGVQLGLTKSGDMPIDIAVGIVLPSSTDTNDYQTAGVITETRESRTDSCMIIDGLARIGVESWMLAASLQMANISAIQDRVMVPAGADEKSTYEESNLNVSVGAVNTIKASESITVLAGGTINYMSQSITDIDTDTTASADEVERTQETSGISVPLYIAGEGKLNDTWTIRGGVSKAVFNSSTVQDVDKLIPAATTVTFDQTIAGETDDSTTVSLGATAVIGDITVEGDAAVQLIGLGPQLLTGSGTAVSGQIGVSYSWK